MWDGREKNPPDGYCLSPKFLESTSQGEERGVRDAAVWSSPVPALLGRGGKQLGGEAG